MPIDPEVKAELDKITALLTPESMGKLLAPVLEAHGAAVLQRVPKGVDQAALDAALAKLAPVADPKAGKAKEGDDPKLAALTAEIEALKQTNAATERARQETVAKAAQERARAEVKAALGKAGVSSDALDDALAVVERTGVLVLDGDKPGWKQPNKFTPSLIEVVPFEDAATAWAATPAGKRFQAPAAQRGTGDGPTQRGEHNGAPGRFTRPDGSVDFAAIGNAAMANR